MATGRAEREGPERPPRRVAVQRGAGHHTALTLDLGFQSLGAGCR